MADTKTIADELLALIDAKQKINAAINESAVGTTQTGGLSNKLFSEYGDIIKAIFAVQESVGTQDFSSLNEMYRPGKLTCYRIDTAKTSNMGNLPEDMVGVTDRCLNIFSIASESETKYVCQLLITEGKENTFDASTITSMQMFVRLFVPNVYDGTWYKFISKDFANEVYASKSYVNKAIQDIDISSKVDELTKTTSVINPATPKAGDIKVDGKDIYIRDGENNWQLMNSWQ